MMVFRMYRGVSVLHEESSGLLGRRREVRGCITLHHRRHAQLGKERRKQRSPPSCTNTLAYSEPQRKNTYSEDGTVMAVTKGSPVET